MAKRWPTKDPEEVLDYVIDWAGSTSEPGRAFGDAISSSTWTVPVGITKDSDTFAAGNTTIWLSGGTLGETYTLLNHIVTAAGREMEQSVAITIKAR